MDSTITGKVGPRWVEAVIADGVQPLLALDLADGSRLSATPNHLFYVDGGPGIAHPEWLAAGDLQAGDRLRTKDAKDTTILRVRYHTGYAQVYTLTVATDHDFFVGPDAVLVHNCPRQVDTPEEARAKRKASAYHGPKPEYNVNRAHEEPAAPGNGKDVLPSDAEEVYGNAVPEILPPPNQGKTWWGMGPSGQYYRYQREGAQGAKAHWNGSFDGRDANLPPNDVRQRLAGR